MSYTRVHNDIIDDKNLSAYAKLVFLVICRFASKDGHCWPSLKTLATKASISERQVRYSLRELERKRYIETESRPGKSSVFKIKTPAGDAGVEDIPRQEVPPPRQDVPGSPAQGAAEQDLRTRTKNNYSEQFLSFWEIYPRKEGKAEAFKAWERLLKEGYTPEQLTAAAQRYRASCERKKTERDYIKKGVNFLRHRTFEDYLAGQPPAEEDDPTRKRLERLAAEGEAWDKQVMTR